MLRLLCSCVENVLDKDHDGEIDFMQQSQKSSGEVNSPLDDILKENLLSIKGRRQRIKNIPIDILPTKFDDDEDPPSEDEDGEEASTNKHGLFMGQDFNKIREKCYRNETLWVDPLFPPSNASLFLKHDKWSGNYGIEWKRASELCENPKLFVDGASRFDIKQVHSAFYTHHFFHSVLYFYFYTNSYLIFDLIG